MITRITGILAGLQLDSAYIEVGAFEHEVFVPEFVRRQMQSLIGEEVSLRTIEYMEGNPQKGRLTPRMVGFMNDVEREFFDMICSVDGVGVKKALRAMVRPVREVSVAIEEKDIKQLSTLPGIGPAVAERIVAKLRRKMTKFALMVGEEFPTLPGDTRDLMHEAFEALNSVGHTAAEARKKIDALIETGKKFKNVEEVLTEIYRQQNEE